MLHAGWSKVPHYAGRKYLITLGRKNLIYHYAGRKYLITLAADKMQLWEFETFLQIIK